MIIRMAKVDIVGPKGRLLPVLEALREIGVVQLEGGAPWPATAAHGLHPLHVDSASLARQLWFAHLRDGIGELCALLPTPPLRVAYLDPPAALEALAHLLPRHLDSCRRRRDEREGLQRQTLESSRQAGLLQTLAGLLEGRDTSAGLVQVVGVTLREPELAGKLTAAAEGLTGGRFHLDTAVAPDGTTVGVIATDNDFAEVVRGALATEGVAELALPAELAGLPLEQQVATLSRRSEEARQRALLLAAEEERFARRWLPLYRKVADWLDDRLAVLAAAADVFETELCFCVHGWMPAARVAGLRDELEARFGGEVDLTEGEVCEHDLEQVPVLLHNPYYLRPFELLVRLLPLPRYASIDPTPLVAFFFPLLFGLMLGDLGYGGVLALVAGGVMMQPRISPTVRDGARILMACAVSSMFFGLLFGECFGEEGGQRLGLAPLLFARSGSLVPFLWFALSVGLVHVGLGLILGIFVAARSGHRREAWLRLFNLLILLALVLVGVGWAAPESGLLAVALWSLGVTIPLLLVSGGLLAPLEMLKTIGNVVSYARLMAIGLTSVLLATVANRLGGLSGSIVAGIFVAGLLHLFNLLLGIFAPTVHALRLHYVEFFSKFFEPGGHDYHPLEKRPK